jgi:hypothetical protein
MKAAALVVWTWLCLLPVGAFHHLVRFGVLGWGTLDAEAMNDGEGGGLAFHWASGLLVSSLTAWLAGIFLARRLLRIPKNG